MIDSHCHLDNEGAEKSPAQLLSEAKAAGISTLITIATDLPSIERVQKISDAHPGEIFHTVGVHPHEAHLYSPGDELKVEGASHHPACVGIGELGLDYFYKHSESAPQIEALKKQLEVAVRRGLPAVIHSRDAEEDLLKELEPYSQAFLSKNPSRSPGVIHCFTGTYDFGLKCLSLGFYISFSGILTFKNADEIRRAARDFPLDRILVETDAPYLAPIPHRGKKCEPAMVKFTAMKLAELRNKSLSEIDAVTEANTRALFRI